MSTFIIILGSTLITGSAYALLGLSFSITFSSCRVFNFAVGQSAILAGLIFATPLLADNLASAGLTIIAMAVFGALVYSLLLRRPDMRGEDPLIMVIITLGVAEILTNGSTLMWGGFARAAPALLHGQIHVGDASFPKQGALLVCIAAAAIVAVGLIQRYTLIGQAFRAIGASRYAARLYGVNDWAIQAIAWASAAVLAGLVGVLYTPLTSVTMSFALMLGVQGFTAAIIGGIGSALGAIVAGAGLALVYTLMALYVNSGYAYPLTFVILLGFLLVRPAGLFGNPREVLGPRA